MQNEDKNLSRSGHPSPTDTLPHAPVTEAHQTVECKGLDHEWDPTWQSGDTCACGMFYLFTDGAKCWLSVQEGPSWWDIRNSRIAKAEGRG